MRTRTYENGRGETGTASLASVPSPAMVGEVQGNASEVPSRGLQLLLLTLAALSGAFARTSVSPLQEVMSSALALTDNQVALLQGPALAAPLILLAAPLGFLIDHRSRVRLLMIFAALDVVGSLLTALVTSFWALFAARCLVGLTAFAINPVVISLIADFYAPERRGRALMAMAVGQFAGMALAFGLGGVLITATGSGAQAWRWAIVWLTGPLVPVALLMLKLREPARTGLAVANPSVLQAASELWAYRAVILPLLSGVIMVEVAIGAVLIWTAPAFTRTFSLSPDRVGAIMAAGLIVSGVVGPLGGGMLADVFQRRGGPRLTVTGIIGISLLCVLSGAFAIAPGVISASALLLLFMTLIGALVVMATTLFSIVIPNELRGLCMSVLAAASVLFGTGVAPVTVSLLSGAMGGPTLVGKALTIVCAAGSLIATLVFLMGRQHFPGRAES